MTDNKRESEGIKDHFAGIWNWNAPPVSEDEERLEILDICTEQMDLK